MNNTKKQCGACKEEKIRSEFSKKQWERKKFRRCKSCVNQEVPFQRPSKNDHSSSSYAGTNPTPLAISTHAIHPVETMPSSSEIVSQNNSSENLKSTPVEASTEESNPISSKDFPTDSSPNNEESPRAIIKVSTAEILDIDVEPIVNVEQEINDLLGGSSPEPPPSVSTPTHVTVAENHTNVADVDNNNSHTDDANNRTSEGDPIFESNVKEEHQEPPLTPAAEIENDAQHWDPSSILHWDPISMMPPQPSDPPPDVPTSVGGSDLQDDTLASTMRSCSKVGLFSLLSFAATAVSGLVAPDKHWIMVIFALVSAVLATAMLVQQLYDDNHANSDEDVDELAEPLLSSEVV
jgi:hypothetical protein